MSEKDRVVLRGIPANHPKCATEFLTKVINLSKQGYELLTEIESNRERASFVGFPTCVMVRNAVPDFEEVATPEQAETVEVVENVEPTGNTLLDSLTALTKKDDLLNFAKENNIEVPETAKVPLAIKKFLIEHISK